LCFSGKGKPLHLLKRTRLPADEVGVKRLFSPGNLLVFAAIATGACVFAAVDASTRVASDVYLFAAAGSEMFSSQWPHTFQSSVVQAGPLELGLTSVARTAGGGMFGFAIILDLICAVAITAAAAWFLRGRTYALVLFCAGALLLWLPGEGYRGHPAELLIPVLWMVAAAQARRDRPALAGALVGVSACLELWGVLGVAVLALSPYQRRTASGVTLAIVLPIVSLLPFVAGGDFHMFDYHWGVHSGLGLLLLGAGQPFTWYDRVVEGALVVGAGVVIARLTRRMTESVWIVPAAIALVRIGLDPVRNDYYWDVPLVLLLIGGAALVAERGELKVRLAAGLASSTR
jgi:uncharacterized membrane protein